MVRLVKTKPVWVTSILTFVAYGLVIGTLYGNLFGGIYPNIGIDAVNVLSHTIAVNNLIAVLVLAVGWILIKSERPRMHRFAMTIGFMLIIVFLVLYLIKTGGGGRKEFMIGQGQLLSNFASSVTFAYYGMLAIHILLSMVSVPLVVHTLILGISRPLSEVPGTSHSTVGPWAAGCWIVSLVLGLVCYMMLNHIYTYEFVAA